MDVESFFFIIVIDKKQCQQTALKVKEISWKKYET
jgi:hypothetical protein